MFWSDTGKHAMRVIPSSYLTSGLLVDGCRFPEVLMASDIAWRVHPVWTTSRDLQTWDLLSDMWSTGSNWRQVNWQWKTGTKIRCQAYILSTLSNLRKVHSAGRLAYYLDCELQFDIGVRISRDTDKKSPGPKVRGQKGLLLLELVDGQKVLVIKT